MRAHRYDVAIVGAGIAGCTAALASAARGDRVLLLEQDPHTERRGGVWLHPPAMDALEELGVDLVPPVGYPTGKGFVVTPEDGSSPIVLPYESGRFGFSLPRALLVETLRGHCAARDLIEYVPHATATRIESGVLAWEVSGEPKSTFAERHVCATGTETHIVRRGESVSFGALERPSTHRLARLDLVGAELPFEGYRHIFVGGPGPAVAFRVAPSVVSLWLDVPLSMRVAREGGIELVEGYAPALPAQLVEPFVEALQRSAPEWSRGRIAPRGDVTRGGVARVGDAAGSLHPLTAAGATLGIADAVAHASSSSLEEYRRQRRRGTRVPEAVGIGLAELLTDSSPETVAIRRATYRSWRKDPRERLRSMGFVSGESRGALRFGGSCLRVMLSSAASVAKEGARAGNLENANRVGIDMLTRMGWMVGGSLGWTQLLPSSLVERLEARGTSRFGGAISAEPGAEVVGLPSRTSDAGLPVESALERATTALIAEQAEDGSFEGEVVWCPMLAAQYVLACHVMGREIEPERRRLFLKHFEHTKLEGGAWGLGPVSEPYLFVTTLVYVAARLLGVDREDALVVDAKAFIRREGGAVGIPSWGKLWLALVGLYEWDGVNPVVPELWAAPRWLPIHPSRYYCHTRLIYMGMATLYGSRLTRPATATVRCVRDEIFLTPYDEIDFGAARETLREGDIHDAPGALLKLSYRALVMFDRTRSLGARRKLLNELRERIRYELHSTSFTCISPVSGLLGILALHGADPEDPDVETALESFDGWIWEDEEEGARVAGARSATWDTSFATQALTAAAPIVDVREALSNADAFLVTQQMKSGTGREADYDRLDPTGGYCFAGVWHGWPVSDCTAEAMLARLGSPEANPTPREMTEAARFIMQCQNTDGGFGSYESQRVEVPIDWINPSEMFGACMTERSYVECTASCTTALAEFRRHYPDRLLGVLDDAVDRGVARIRAAQRPDGSFEGMWGVHFIYGTMFGVRGLLAGGVPCVDPQIRRACAWLLERQRPDGGWGEHYDGVIEGRYVEHEQAQTVQTAWALSTLLEAQEPDFGALERAARFLARTQNPDGTWDEQDPEGIFFHTALLDYRLYRRYFPPWALGLFAQRARARAQQLDPRERRPRAGATSLNDRTLTERHPR